MVQFANLSAAPREWQRDMVGQPHAGAGMGMVRGLRRETRHLLRVRVSSSKQFMFPNMTAAPGMGTFHRREHVSPLKRRYPGVVQTEGGSV